MHALFDQVIGTIILRPYFVTFLLACSLHLGAKRAIVFSVAGYLIAWLSEVSSIHNGIPYGLYYYIESTRGRELWVFGVPFMDSMSFVFLSYASYSMALLTLSPILIENGAYMLESRKIRGSLSARLLGALYFTYLDIIIDPVSLRGSKWFLGQIYGYPAGGAYFGVPISNFVGWFIVGCLLIYALQLIDRTLYRASIGDWFGKGIAWRYLLGPALYVSILAFNLTITCLIGEFNIFWAGIFIAVLPMALLVVSIRTGRMPLNIEQALRTHLVDFPGTALPGFGTSPSGDLQVRYPK